MPGNFKNSIATTNATLVQGKNTDVFNLVATNIGAAVAFLKVYNKVTAPVPGTDVPVLTFPIPAGGFIAPAFGAKGIHFPDGFGYAITNLAADADVTAVAAAQVKVSATYN